MLRKEHIFRVRKCCLLNINLPLNFPELLIREYESRLSRYAERIWTCKSTGSNQLTHKEAWEEEQEVTEL